MGYDQKRYSPLKHINDFKVKRLVPAWNALSGVAGDARGRSAAPSVPSGRSVWTFALME